MIHFNQSAHPFIRNGVIAFFLFIFAISGLVFAESQAGDKALLKVTLMLYSGRPNPVYYIEDQNTVNNMKALFAKNQKNLNFKKTTVVPNILGYQGIIVENLKQIKDLPAKFIIYNNDIEIIGSGSGLKTASLNPEFLVDSSGSLETLLLDYGVSKNAYSKEVREKVKQSANK
jgi:hypothetical protein